MIGIFDPIVAIMNSLLASTASDPRRGLDADADASTSLNDPTKTAIPTIVSGTSSPPDVADGEAQEPEAPFPQQLMDVIEKETEGGSVVDGERVLEWIPSGKAFVIRDKGKLEKEVLPKYFRVKCKFASFARKLYRQVYSCVFSFLFDLYNSIDAKSHFLLPSFPTYRWGFRQVKKELHGIMIFMHPNFVRGDKQRCLKMRSIVKKPQQRTFNINFFPNGFPAGNTPQGFGAANIMFNTEPSFSSNGISPHQMYSSLNQIGAGNHYGLVQGNNSLGKHGVDHGGPSSLFSSNEAGHHLQRMEQRQEQQMMLDMLNTSKPAHRPPPSTFSSSVWDNNFEKSNNLGYGGISKVNLLASEIMRQDPRMEPSRALELAKHFNH